MWGAGRSSKGGAPCRRVNDDGWHPICLCSFGAIGAIGAMAIMTEEAKRGRAQDRAKVAGGQKHETAYEARKTGTTSREVRRP